MGGEGGAGTYTVGVSAGRVRVEKLIVFVKVGGIEEFIVTVAHLATFVDKAFDVI